MNSLRAVINFVCLFNPGFTPEFLLRLKFCPTSKRWFWNSLYFFSLLIRRLVELLMHNQLSVISAALLAFGNFVCLFNQGFPIGSSVLPTQHSELKCLISFGNWFWHLIVTNRSMLNFYQKRPQRPIRPKRPMKASKGQQRPANSKSLISSIFNV